MSVSPPIEPPQGDICAYVSMHQDQKAVGDDHAFSPAMMAVIFGLRMIVTPCTRPMLPQKVSGRGPFNALTQFLKVIDQGARRRLRFLPLARASGGTDEMALTYLIADAQRGFDAGCAARSAWLVRSGHCRAVIDAAYAAAAALRAADLILPPPPRAVCDAIAGGAPQPFEVLA